MKTKYITLATTFYFLLSTFCCFSQVETPAPAQSKSILLMNGIAHLGNGNIIENSVIAFAAGKLTMVADARVVKIDPKAFDTIINVQGKHIYPGFIAPNSTLGLVEIDAVRATEDMNESGNYTPHVRSIIAYNAESKITTTVRSNGVLMAQITPRGNIVSGTSSIVQFDAWNW
jgi:imidazolonepropionase-like amidohydrolase